MATCAGRVQLVNNITNQKENIMGLLGDAVKKGAQRGVQAAGESAGRRLAGTHKVNLYCCGGTKGKHLGGCEGVVHDDYKGLAHTGEIAMSAKQYKKFLDDGGKTHSSVQDGEGGFIVHVKRWPR